MKKIAINNLKIDEDLVDFINNEAIPGTNIDSKKFWSSFDNFETAPLPKDKYEYLSYKSKLQDFVQARNQRILNSTINGE